MTGWRFLPTADRPRTASGTSWHPPPSAALQGPFNGSLVLIHTEYTVPHALILRASDSRICLAAPSHVSVLTSYV